MAENAGVASRIIRALTLKNRRESHSHSVLHKSRPTLKRIHQSSSLKQEFFVHKVLAVHSSVPLRENPAIWTWCSGSASSNGVLNAFVVQVSCDLQQHQDSHLFPVIFVFKPCPAFFRAWARGFLQAQNQDSKTPGLFCYFRILQRHYPY